jgi:hypothetical protein
VTSAGSSSKIDPVAAMGAHPYSPAGLDLPGYVPLRLSQLEIVGPYLGASLFVLTTVWLLSGKRDQNSLFFRTSSIPRFHQ